MITRSYNITGLFLSIFSKLKSNSVIFYIDCLAFILAHLNPIEQMFHVKKKDIVDVYNDKDEVSQKQQVPFAKTVSCPVISHF